MKNYRRLALVVLLILVVVAILSGGRQGRRYQTGEKDGQGEDEISIVIVSEGKSKEKPDDPKKEQAEKKTEAAGSYESEKDQAGGGAAGGGEGAFPPIWMNYHRELGFKRYAQEMERLGCVFLLFIPSENRLYQIDRENLRLMPFVPKTLGVRYTASPKRIENEPAAEKYLALADGKEGEIYLALPREVEEKIKNVISRGFAEKGIKVSEVLGIQGFYAFEKGQLTLNVEQIVLKSGRPSPPVQLSLGL